MAKRRGKFKNKKVEYKGILFDSMLERDYYIELLRLQKKGTVKSVELQPSFELIPRFKRHGKTHRPMTYTADFEVEYEDGTVEIIDTKGVQTEPFRIKRKLLEYQNEDILFYLVKRDRSGKWSKKR